MRLLATIGIRLLEAIFLFGIAGSALVVILAGVEDLREVLQKDNPRRDAPE
jgi:hypothetical protein